MKFLAVRGARTERELHAYLYSTNKVVGPVVERDNRVFAVVECPSSDAAQYQADRYASGMIGASLHDTRFEARENL